MKIICVNNQMNAAKLFDTFLKLKSANEKDVKLLVTATAIRSYDAIGLRDTIATFTDVFNITADICSPLSINTMTILSGLPTEAKKIGKSGYAIFSDEAWFAEGKSTDMNILHEEKQLLVSNMEKLISETSALTPTDIAEHRKEGKLMTADLIVDLGLAGGYI